MSSAEILTDLETVMATSASGVTREGWLDAANAILEEEDLSTLSSVAPAALRICQSLYGQARSFDALPLSLALFQRASDIEDTRLIHNSAVVAGLLSSDTSDFAGALEFHGRALEIMNSVNDDVGASRSWNNVGSALCGVGRYELASVSFRHALTRLTNDDRPLFSRYGALGNLAQCALHTGELDSGLDSARLALAELERGRTKFPDDPFSELLLRRNLVRLQVAKGDLKAAESQLPIAKALAFRDGGARAAIALATCLASVEIAQGRFDIAGTRLETSLAAARPILPALRDTLACIVRADEAQGNSARAMVRLRELSELIHRAGTDSAKAHIGLSRWRNSIHVLLAASDSRGAASGSTIRPPPATVPATWATLTRLALGNALQIDPTAAHGTRVGALSRLLALACGLGPLEALEVGIAAQLHDIGIAADSESLVGSLGNLRDGPAAEDDLSHSDAGWRILCEDDHPRILLAREIAKYHHAWVNGEGHPTGLTSAAIPLPARICAVADAYDNIMTTVGTTEDTIEHGLARLRAMAGARLDPELVGLFVDVLENETRNEGIDFESGNGLTSFNQLIRSLSKTQQYI